ncbi:dUTP diphosphatase [Mycoplasma sp. 1781]
MIGNIIIIAMDLKEIFMLQIDLDKAFSETISKKDFRFFDTKIVIALLVELGEFANEVKAFKYWKKNKVIDREKMLEEFADGIHFITSIAYPKGISPIINPYIKHKNFTLQLAYTYKLFTELLNTKDKNKVLKAYEAYLGLGLLVDIQEEDIVNSYLAKNKKNYQRIKNRY